MDLSNILAQNDAQYLADCLIIYAWAEYEKCELIVYWIWSQLLL